MSVLTSVSVSVWNSSRAIVVDAKFITSVLAGAIGTAAAVLRNLAEMSEDRSKRTMEKVATARVTALLDLLVKVPQSDSFSACGKELELQLAHSLSKLDAHRMRALKRAQAPNHDLTFLRRLFVFFPPKRWLNRYGGSLKRATALVVYCRLTGQQAPQHSQERRVTPSVETVGKLPGCR